MSASTSVRDSSRTSRGELYAHQCSLQYPSRMALYPCSVCPGRGFLTGLSGHFFWRAKRHRSRRRDHTGSAERCSPSFERSMISSERDWAPSPYLHVICQSLSRPWSRSSSADRFLKIRARNDLAKLCEAIVVCTFVSHRCFLFQSLGPFLSSPLSFGLSGPESVCLSG